jgi:hypothetical protein
VTRAELPNGVQGVLRHTATTTGQGDDDDDDDTSNVTVCGSTPYVRGPPP